jgi:hypothetical protein
MSGGESEPIPEPFAEALRLGTRLAAEVESSSPDRLAGVTIWPHDDEMDRRAELEGWRRSNPHRAFYVVWREYSREYLVRDWDFEPGNGQWNIASATVVGLEALAQLLLEWSVPLSALTYVWKSPIPE